MVIYIRRYVSTEVGDEHTVCTEVLSVQSFLAVLVRGVLLGFDGTGGSDRGRSGGGHGASPHGRTSQP